jgi:hypothetical protein
MWSVIEQWVLVPILALTATYQLVLAALTRTTVFICTKACTASAGSASLADEPLLFYLALTQAFVFLGWATWLYAKRP